MDRTRPMLPDRLNVGSRTKILYLNDSKKLSAKTRSLLYDEICEKASAYGVGIVPHGRIDEINIARLIFQCNGGFPHIRLQHITPI